MLVKVNCAKIKLQVLATPIGNLEEITLRAINTLKNCCYILCEDTRITKKILSKLNIHGKELISYQKFNEDSKLNLVLEKIKQGSTVLVSDAGYPCLSDPGYSLINECYKQNIAIEVINGPSSLMHALTVSGLNLDNFYFCGFLSPNKNKREKKLKEFTNFFIPIIFFESVHRIKQTLLDINNIFYKPYFVVCRELTKINETIYRGNYEEIIDLITEKGEFVIIVIQQQKNKEISFDKTNLIKQVNDILKGNDLTLKQATKKIALQNNIPVSILYDMVINNKKNND